MQLCLWVVSSYSYASRNFRVKSLTTLTEPFFYNTGMPKVCFFVPWNSGPPDWRIFIRIRNGATNPNGSNIVVSDDSSRRSVMFELWKPGFAFVLTNRVSYFVFQWTPKIRCVALSSTMSACGKLIKASGLFDTNSVKLSPHFSNVDFTFRTETSAMSIDSKEWTKSSI